ncbi:MAG: substrate-binding domain-containing protein [Actinobacteria bacterium]|nr:substrate-binding domain-containing protein [Actinomycetota bacterium]
MIILVLVMGLGVAVSACGSSNSETDTGGESSGGGNGSETSTSASQVVKPFEEKLKELYAGTSEPPNHPPVKAEPGKSVWVISVGQGVETTQHATEAMEEAGEKLAWNVTIFDGKFESARELTGIQQAISAKADGIVLLYIDCAPIKSGLEQAKNAEIPVVGIESKDCDPPLETAPVLMARGVDYIKFEEEMGEGQATWAIAETGGEAKTINVEETDASTTLAVGKGVQNAFERCSTCELVDDIKFVGTELGPALQQKIEQALNQYPDANSLIVPYDGVLTTSGGAAALRASGRLPELKVMGGEGSVPGIELIRNEAGMDACAGISTAWSGYDAMMVLSQLFAGRDPVKGNSGIGVQLCDKEHNLPPKGHAYVPSIDFVATYEKIWGLK